MTSYTPLSRRAFMAGSTGLLALASFRPAWAQSASPGSKGSASLTGSNINLTIDRRAFEIDGQTGSAVTINGSVPGPLIRLREGDNARLTVTNLLDEDSSIHWHGLILPFQMDGVPGVSFPGIAPGASFTYEFPVRQAGTYWYHSHSGLQEPVGHYAPMIIDPQGTDPIASDREHVIVLSDWTFANIEQVVNRLKQGGGFFNHAKPTLTDPLPLDRASRRMFDRMRMDPTDIADVGAPELIYLVNGHSPAENWTGLFAPGERVRLRVINAASLTVFNFRIPGLPLTVVAADGLPVRPVEVDELQIGNGETYDLIVTPRDPAYSVVAEGIDRSGMAVATLATSPGLRAPVPLLRERPVLTMRDMGMDHSSHGAPAGPTAASDPPAGMDRGSHGAAMPMAPSSDPHAAHSGHGGSPPPAPPPMQDRSTVGFPTGPGVDMIASMPVDRTGDPGLGLEGQPHRVLTYRQLAALQTNPDRRVPEREIVIHLTGNMERYMWSMDGETLSENTEPYRFTLNERVRLRLVNDTMMTHPMHLHGHFFEVVNGQEDGHLPLKHTVRVLPGSYVDLNLTADAPGDWAFHCHLLVHMHMGMMRVVKIRPLTGEGQ